MSRNRQIDEHERGITMSKKNITTATTTATTMTAAEFKQKFNRVYPKNCVNEQASAKRE